MQGGLAEFAMSLPMLGAWIEVGHVQVNLIKCLLNHEEWRQIALLVYIILLFPILLILN